MEAYINVISELIKASHNKHHNNNYQTVVLLGPFIKGLAYSTNSSINTGHAPEKENIDK